MPSPFKVFPHNFATLIDMVKGQYNEDQWYKRYRRYLWTEKDDHFIKTLLAVTHYWKTEEGNLLPFTTIDRILRVMVEDEGQPPCIKYAKRGNFSASEVFGAEKIYTASQKNDDLNYQLYQEITRRHKRHWEGVVKGLQARYQVKNGTL